MSVRDRLDPEQRAALAMGEHLFAIRDTAGFKALETYLGNLATSGAFRALDDDDPKQGATYWRGYVAAARQIVADIDLAIQQAQALKAELEEGGASFQGMRIGGGSIGGQ